MHARAGHISVNAIIALLCSANAAMAARIITQDAAADSAHRHAAGAASPDSSNSSAAAVAPLVLQASAWVPHKVCHRQEGELQGERNGAEICKFQALSCEKLENTNRLSCGFPAGKNESHSLIDRLWTDTRIAYAEPVRLLPQDRRGFGDGCNPSGPSLAPLSVFLTLDHANFYHFIKVEGLVTYQLQHVPSVVLSSQLSVILIARGVAAPFSQYSSAEMASLYVGAGGTQKMARFYFCLQRMWTAVAATAALFPFPTACYVFCLLTLPQNLPTYHQLTLSGEP